MNETKNCDQNQITINLEELLEDYELDFGVFSELDDRLLDIQDEYLALTITEKILLILYSELKSYRKVAKVLGFSHSTVAKQIKDIRNKLC